MSWIAVASAAIPAAIGLGKAGVQAYQARQFAKAKRPEYEIPEATTGALNSAKYQASQTQLPGQTQMQQNLDMNTSRGIASLQDVSSSGAGLSSNIASLYRGNVAGQNQLGIAGAQNWNNNQGILRAALSQYGGYQDKAWDINKFQPYLAKKGAESALREGSFRNLAAAGTDIARAGAGYAMMKNGQNDDGDSLGKDEVSSPGQEAIINPPTMKSNPDAVTGPISYTNPPPVRMSTPTSGGSAINSPIDGGTSSNIQDAFTQFLMQHPEFMNNSYQYKRN